MAKLMTSLSDSNTFPNTLGVAMIESTPSNSDFYWGLKYLVATHHKSLNIVVGEPSAWFLPLSYKLLINLFVLYFIVDVGWEKKLLKEQTGSLEAVLGKQKVWVPLDFDAAVAGDSLR